MNQLLLQLSFLVVVVLAQKLLQTHKGKGGRGGYALVVSTENVTQNW